MIFEWDPAKSEDCLRRRGFDFGHASRIFAGPYLDDVDLFASDETRYIATGPIDGQVYVVTYTERGEVTRIISARFAGAAEVKRWRSEWNL